MKVHWIEHYWNDKNQMVANMQVVHNILNGGTGMIKSEESFTRQLEMAA